ncbi:hypothetical protein CFAM422_011864 [Trichoderma lentiforme]|uniref:Uncharacterized protein n=1 Tax=Trichoderma lentiforme TaxID=1567552 RepID=A0A9P4X5A8_9HYPO|nr:hypothetical protein CFAM422_011864 [Trichoderma lentiforme]
MLALDLGLVSRLSELLWCKAQKILPAQGPPGLSSGKKIDRGDLSACACACACACTVCTVKQKRNKYSDHEQERKGAQFAHKSRGRHEVRVPRAVPRTPARPEPPSGREGRRQAGGGRLGGVSRSSQLQPLASKGKGKSQVRSVRSAGELQHIVRWSRVCIRTVSICE